MKIDMASADLAPEDFAAVHEVLKSGRLALGPKTVAFEEAMAERVEVQHAVAVSSGTAGLHLIVRALGLGPGDEVLVPSFTFAASVNAILFEGATPVFVDIEDRTFNLSVADARAKITPRTRAVMVVDAFGHPADWDGLEELANEHGLALIDDCCEALGSQHRGRPIGSLGDAGCFAFYPNKQITTGEGGMIVTDRDDIAELARSLRNQGRGRMGAWLVHENLGYNYRLDEMSAALGLSQLSRLDTFIRQRLEVASMYTARLESLEWVRAPIVEDYAYWSPFVYVVLLQPGIHRDPIMSFLSKEGIPSRAYFSPIHTQPYIATRFGTSKERLPVTENLADRTLALPFHPKLDARKLDMVVSELEHAVLEVMNWVEGATPKK